jgi:integrase
LPSGQAFRRPVFTIFATCTRRRLLAGVPVHVVAARLGHADPAITLSVYAHVIREASTAVADVFAKAVSDAPR